MPLTLTDSQQVVYTIEADDKKGQPVTGASFDAPPVWAGSNDAVATVTASADGLSATVVPQIPGDVTVSVSAAIKGATVGGSDDLTVTSGAATTVKLVAGAPTDQ